MKVEAYNVKQNTIGLTEEEQRVLIYCVLMAAREGFYFFDWNNVIGGESNVKSALLKLGMSKDDAEHLVSKYN